MKFDIIVPVFQSKNILQLFFESLIKTITEESNIIFINDNSPADTSDYLNTLKENDSLLYKIHVINHIKTQGSSVCINEGFARALNDIVVMIDSDTIMQEHWQEHLIESFQDERVGCVGGILLYPQTGGIQSCGIVFSNSTSKHLFLNSKKSRLAKYDELFVQSTIFAFCAIRKTAIDKVGLMDTEFFNGYEDIDYQLRIKEAGYKIIINKKIELYHWEKSNGIKRNWNRKSNIGLLWKKHSHNIDNDLWFYLRKELSEFIFAHQKYFCVDCCQTRIDAKIATDILKEFIDIVDIIDCSYLCDESKSIWIPEILSSDLYRSPISIVFLCENFVQLRDNQYWYELRRNIGQTDIIVDLYGNILTFTDIINSFWPGTKVR